LNSPVQAKTESQHSTARLAEKICAINYDFLDATTIETVKRLVADGIAVAIAGSVEEPPAIVAGYARDLAAAPLATVWGFGFKTTPYYAAYANAVSMHVLDFEPMSNPPTHAVSPTVPAALAIAEAQHADGRDIITACAKGFEMQGRVLLAGNPERGSLPFHTPGVVGLMGSAVAASHILGLNPAQLAHALGIAGSRCSGLSANTGSMVKCTHCGNAAAAGLEAGLLASRGFTAHPNILEAPHGYVATFFPAHFDYDALFKFGEPFRCVDPGMAIKFYPSKYPTHFAITAALEVRPEIPDPAAIRKIRIVTPEIVDANRPQPRVGLEGKFSFQYTVAAALLDGKIGIDSFTDDRRFRADMVRLLDITEVVYDKSIPKDTRKMQVEVEVTLADGTKRSRICRKPPGTWGIPVNHEQHRAKIRDCLGARLAEPKLSETLELLDGLERLSSKDAARLLELLG
jgi:2-methylcitrate dehydratase PrpD